MHRMLASSTFVLFSLCVSTTGIAAMPIATLQGGVFAHAAETDGLVPERFQFGAGEVNWMHTPPREFARFHSFQLTFPSPVTTEFVRNNTVHCEYYLPKGDGRFPAVIVLHILGGDFELSRICCRTLASQGVASLFLKMPYYGPRRPSGSRERMISADPDKSVARMTQAVKDIRRGVDWLASRDEVDTNRIGITGISLGGIVASLAGSVEPRFARGCFILAGGDFAKLVAESAEMDDVRDAWRGKVVSAEEVGAMLRPIDPLTYAQRLRDRDILLMNARHDQVIPQHCADALWRAAGEPTRVWWNADHYSAIVYLPSALVRITQFFAQE